MESLVLPKQISFICPGLDCSGVHKDKGILWNLGSFICMQRGWRGCPDSALITTSPKSGWPSLVSVCDTALCLTRLLKISLRSNTLLKFFLGREIASRDLYLTVQIFVQILLAMVRPLKA